jgi:hypothetical protein
VTGDVVDLAAKRQEHEPSPRRGEHYYRHGVIVGLAGTREPMAHEYPAACICAGCGKTIRRESPEAEWEHVQWTT